MRSHSFQIFPFISHTIVCKGTSAEQTTFQDLIICSRDVVCAIIIDQDHGVGGVARDDGDGAGGYGDPPLCF